MKRKHRICERKVIAGVVHFRTHCDWCHEIVWHQYTVGPALCNQCNPNNPHASRGAMLGCPHTPHPITPLSERNYEG